MVWISFLLLELEKNRGCSTLHPCGLSSVLLDDWIQLLVAQIVVCMHLARGLVRSGRSSAAEQFGPPKTKQSPPNSRGPAKRRNGPKPSRAAKPKRISYITRCRVETLSRRHSSQTPKPYPHTRRRRHPRPSKQPPCRPSWTPHRWWRCSSA